MVVDLIGRICFRYIGISVVSWEIGDAMSLGINEVVSMVTDVAIRFFGLFL